MESKIKQFGISTALLTPFDLDGNVSFPLLFEHANAMVRNGADSVTLFGTTGEGASIGFDERAKAISGMIDSGITTNKIILGLCGSAIGDVTSQVQQGIEFGLSTFLLPPPFYFKEIDDAGLFEWFSRLFDSVDGRAQFVLYHIPQLTQVPLSIDLVTGLQEAFPERVLAIKDSAGNWEDTKQILEGGGIPVLVGDERLLHKAAALGGKGAISGMANLYPQRMRTVFDTQVEDRRLSEEVDRMISIPVIPALKQAMVDSIGIEAWANVRPPLQRLSSEDRAVIADLFTQEHSA
ncbi:MAG: dihydrodipicolinate synthase family protein [Rhizobiaceae bacterium]